MSSSFFIFFNVGMSKWTIGAERVQRVFGKEMSSIKVRSVQDFGKWSQVWMPVGEIWVSLC